MSKSKFWAGSESEDDSPKKAPVVSKNRFAIESSSESEDWDSSDDSGSDSGSDASSSSYSGSSSGGSSSGRSFNSSSGSSSSYDTSSEEESASEEAENNWEGGSMASSNGGPKGETEAQARERRSKRWLKDSDDESSSSSSEDDKDRRREEKRQKQKLGKSERVATTESAKVVEAMKLEELIMKTSECLKLRGKKGVDRAGVVSRLEGLLDIADASFSAIEQATLLAGLLSFQLDVSIGGFGALPRSQWKSCTNTLLRLLALTQSNPSLYLRSSEIVDPTVVPESLEEERRKLSVQLSNFAELLDEDLYKASQLADPQQPEEYCALLAEIPRSMANLIEVMKTVESVQGTSLLSAKLGLKLMEHLHYHSCETEQALFKRLAIVDSSAIAFLQSVSETESGHQAKSIDSYCLMKGLARKVGKFGGLKEKSTAMLLLAFFVANREINLSLAKRLINCDMTEYLNTADVGTQVMYNRVLAVVGIASFKAGSVSESHFYLSELCNKSRELLAQSVSRGSAERTAEQEKAERRRQVPYHMHVDIEAVEAAHFISAMMLEIPNIAGGRGRVSVSRAFRKFAEWYDRNLSAGPPENYRDTLALVGRALLGGDVDKAVDLLSGLDIWTKFGLQVKSLIIVQLRECALKTFLTSNLPVNEAYRVSQLGALFGISDESVKDVVSGWVMAGELEAAALDESRTNVVSHNQKVNRLALLAAEITDKIVIK